MGMQYGYENKIRIITNLGWNSFDESDHEKNVSHIIGTKSFYRGDYEQIGEYGTSILRFSYISNEYELIYIVKEYSPQEIEPEKGETDWIMGYKPKEVTMFHGILHNPDQLKIIMDACDLMVEKINNYHP